MNRVGLRSAAVLVAVFAWWASYPTLGQDKGKETPPAVDRWTDARSSATIAGQKVDYVSTAGTMLLREEDGKPLANIFFVAYNRVKVTEAKPPTAPTPPPSTPPSPPTPTVSVSPPDVARPITFCFNGGPGSSSVWLHLGAFGPKKAVLPDDGSQPPPPAKLADNDFSILDFTDLVFVDPVNTGYSRAAPGVDPKRFFGVQEDVGLMGEFIRTYLTRFQRWGSPKYLAGESYGTTRAAALAAHLYDAHGLELSGVVLISSILNFGTARFDEGNDLPYALFLPSYTAAAYYHKKLPGDMLSDLGKAVAESEQFAAGEYTTALMKGDKLSPGERGELAKRLARYTGLSEDFILKCDCRVEIGRFCKELLRDQGKTVGRFDSRLKGSDADLAGDRPENDPSYSAVYGAFAGAMQQYVRKDLKFESDLKYEVLTGKVQPWDFAAKNQYLNVSGPLAAVMRKNPTMKLFVASGYYDLATPYFATDYTLRHLRLGGSPGQRINAQQFEAGHMMYSHKPSHEKLRKELAAFYGVK